MNSSVKFWDRFANRYAKQPIGDDAAYQEKLRITRKYLNPGSRVFEFGCGTGSTALLHAPYVKEIIATDYSASMIAIASGKADSQGVTNVSFRQSGVEEFSDDRRFDAVLGMSILHLVDNKDDVIAKVYDMLEPAGVFMSNTACIGKGSFLLKLLLPIGSFTGLLPSVRFFTDEDLINSLKGAGFSIDHMWQPEKGQALFIVAKKPG